MPEQARRQVLGGNVLMSITARHETNRRFSR
jgi:hypothetical protein